MVQALGLSWALLGFVLAFLSTIQANPNPYYNLYRGPHVEVKPYYGWPHPSKSIEVPYFIEGICIIFVIM